MKNIFIHPTDQPSRLVKNNEGKLKLTIQTLPFDNIIGCYPQSIYITSSEEIRKNDYYIHNNRIGQSAAGEQEKGDYKNCKKIILTTDPILIADGVQAIDDEFLKWFVKNPSCECVEVKHFNNDCHGECGICDNSCGNYYRICIPQKEPKQESCICPHTKIQCDDECCVSAEDCHITSSLVSGIEEPKQEKEEEYFKHLEKDKKEFAKEWDEIRQEFGFDKKEETLEEAAEQYSQGWGENDDVKSFIAGGKYVAERMYSEEEVLNILHDYRNHFELYRNIQVLPDMFFPWFEQFKKK